MCGFMDTREHSGRRPGAWKRRTGKTQIFSLAPGQGNFNFDQTDFISDLAAVAAFYAKLTEDRNVAGMSYVDFLCHVHRLIQNKFQ